MRVKSSGIAPGLANARYPGSAKFANTPPLGLQGEQMARSSPGGGGEVGAAGIDWYINLKCFIHVKITNLLWINK